MSGLSNLRLSLALHRRARDTPAFSTAIADVAREIDATLAAPSLQPRTSPLPDPGDERAIAAVPHLLPRVHRTLADAGRVAAQAAQIEALASASPTPTPTPAAPIAAAKDEAPR